MPMIRPRLPFIKPSIARLLSALRHAGLVPGIHVLPQPVAKTWMAGTSPAMTKTTSVSAATSHVQPAEHQRGVGAAEAEGVRQHGADLGVVDALAHDRHVGEHGIELLD